MQLNVCLMVNVYQIHDVLVNNECMRTNNGKWAYRFVKGKFN